MPKLSKINLDQLAYTRIILRYVEPKLDNLYTLLLVASDCKGRIHLSQNQIATMLKLKNGRAGKMFNQLSNLLLIAKDYTATERKQAVHTILPVCKSALHLHVRNIPDTGFEGMLDAVKEQANFDGDEYLSLDEIRRQVALDKLQSASTSVPRKAYTHKNNSAPMKYGHMFDNNGLSHYYDENICSPEGVADGANKGNRYLDADSAMMVETKGVKHVSRTKKFSNAQHILIEYIEIINLLTTKENELISKNELVVKSKTHSCTQLTYVVNSEIPPTPSTEPEAVSTIPSTDATSLQPVVVVPNGESVVTPVDSGSHQSSTGLHGAIVMGKTYIPLMKPFPSRREALESRFKNFNVNDSTDAEKMAYCIYSYNRLVRQFPNLKQMQIPKALFEGRFTDHAGQPAWMDNLFAFVNGEDWFQHWTGGLVRIANNSFLRDGTETWKMNFPWLFSIGYTVGSEDGDIDYFHDHNFHMKIINSEYWWPVWYRQYDNKAWFPTEMYAADVRLIDIDPWFKDNVEQFNRNYDYPLEGTCPESQWHTPADEYFVRMNDFEKKLTESSELSDVQKLRDFGFECI